MDFTHLIQDQDKAGELAYKLTLQKYECGEIEDYEFEYTFYDIWSKLNNSKKLKDAKAIMGALEKYGEPDFNKCWDYTEKELEKMERLHGVVYVITNVVTNKRYVGKTKNSFNMRYRGANIGIARVYGHIKQNMSGNTHLFTSILKYGFDSFKVDIVFKSDSDYELCTKEKDLIAKYKSDNPQYGYNKTVGGDGVVRGAEELFSKNNYLDGVNPQKMTKLLNSKVITYEELMEYTNKEIVIVYKYGKDKDCFYLYSSINNLMKGTRGNKQHKDYISKGEVFYKCLNNHGYNLPYGSRNINVYLLEDLNIPDGFKFYNHGGKYYTGVKPSLKD